MGEETVLVVGSGGREHTLVDKLSQSPHVEKIYCWPGNGGTATTEKAENVPGVKDTDIEAIAKFAEDNKISLTVVGPELPLMMGLVDIYFAKHLPDRGIHIFGPTSTAAQIEGSKALAKAMFRYSGVPTSQPYRICNSPKEAREYLIGRNTRIVIKADGLCAGKGVFLPSTEKEAYDAIDQIMVKKIFGDAGNKVIIEKRVKGKEGSMFFLSDGCNSMQLASAMDHKRRYDNDKGKNTGGMGAISPAPYIQPWVEKEMNDHTLHILQDMADLGRTFVGCWYWGLMVRDSLLRHQINALEVNARFGDPETQVVLQRFKGDLYEALMACAQGQLGTYTADIASDAAACIVMAAKGYPETSDKGTEIVGLEKFHNLGNPRIIHAGTKYEGGKYYTNGGRILGVTATGATLDQAIENAYGVCHQIKEINPLLDFRSDIGKTASRRQ